MTRLQIKPVRFSRCLPRSALLGLLAGGLAFASLAGAQTTPRPREMAREQGIARSANSMTGAVPLLEGALDDSLYVVGPGDQFRLSILGIAPMQETLVVDLEGRLLLPDLGTVDASGRSLAELRAVVLERMRRQHPRSQITFALIAAREFRAFVTGNVAEAGSYQVSPVDRVSDLVAKTGPLRADASLRNIIVRGKDGTQTPVDLQRFYRLGDLSTNPFLRDGDVVVVPWTDSWVEIYGAVPRPGRYDFVRGEAFSELVELAGGLREGTLTDSIKIVRFLEDGETTASRTISFPAEDPVLQPRDQVFLRPDPSWKSGPVVTLQGEFRYPMVLPIVEGETRVTDVIRASGGFTEEAALDRTSLTRADTLEQNVDLEFERLKQIPVADMSVSEYEYYKMKLREKPGRMRVDFPAIVADPNHPDNITLQGGDIIFSPRDQAFVQVSGQVSDPGNIKFTPGLSAYDYIERAGGYSWNARKSHVTLIRAATGERVQKPGKDVSPAPGDVVWVPEKPERDYWVIFKDGIAVAAQAATVILLAREIAR